MTDQIVVKTQDCGDHWEAFVNDGWWFARGDTREKATQNVLDKIRRDYERQGWSIELHEHGKPVQMELFE